jgi:hypothetical protein
MTLLLWISCSYEIIVTILIWDSMRLKYKNAPLLHSLSVWSDWNYWWWHWSGIEAIGAIDGDIEAVMVAMVHTSADKLEHCIICDFHLTPSRVRISLWVHVNFFVSENPSFLKHIWLRVVCAFDLQKPCSKKPSYPKPQQLFLWPWWQESVVYILLCNKKGKVRCDSFPKLVY